MTVTFYTAEVEDPVTGQRHHGSITWDKYHPRRLTATIGRVLQDSTVDYAAWKASSTNNRAGLDALIQKMERHVKSEGFQLKTSEETKFAPKAHC